MAAPAAAVSQQSSNTSQTNLAPVPAQPTNIPPPPQSQQPQQPQQGPPQPRQLQTSLSPPVSVPSSLTSAATSPSKTSLTNWWKGFKSKTPFKKGDEPEIAPKGIFGVSLNSSIQYAYVNISITNASGNSEVYGRIPIIVAKCGVFLKEKATDVEGIFRVSGSAKRIKELQSIFDSPPTYGKTLDWDGFNVHDGANVFRRYINHLPEPIIPYDYYFAFRKPLETEPPNVEDTVRTYQRLIGQLPKLNGQLLLYILDLLAVFAENSSANLMPATNLAAIFQPGLLSHPDHDMNPQQYRVSQEVLIFLIQHQERFLPSAAAKLAQAAQQPPAPAAPATYQGVHTAKDVPQGGISIPRRRTMKDASPTFAGKVLRRHRSTRTPQSPKLTVEQEEPRRVSEGSAPTTPASPGVEEEGSTPLGSGIERRKTSPTRGRETSYEEGKEEVLSSPITWSSQPLETKNPESTVLVTTKDDPTKDDEDVIDVSQQLANVTMSEPNHVTELTKSTEDGVTNGGFLSVSSPRMGRSSRLNPTRIPVLRASYREELDEVIEYGDQTTSADNTEPETSDADKPDSKKKTKKDKRASRLPWSSSSDNEAKVSSIFSFTSAPSALDDGDTSKPLRKLQKKKRPRDADVHVNAIGIALSVGRPSSLKSPDSDLAQSERGFGTLSPQPWTQQSNVSQSSLKSSDFSRRSHLSSNRSSAEIHRSGTSIEMPRSETPVEHTPTFVPPTTFAAIQQRSLEIGDDDLPTQVVMPAARADKPRTSSHSSNQSAASSGKGSKIGAWLRKKRGFSVSSSTSAGGGGSAVSD